LFVLLFFQDEAIQKRREELIKEQEEKRKQRQVNFLTICPRKDINGKAENTLIFILAMICTLNFDHYMR
jgi:hypothetical protein